MKNILLAFVFLTIIPLYANKNNSSDVMGYYKLLGVSTNASAGEIKKLIEGSL